MESNKTKETKQKQTYREQTDGCQTGGALGLGEEGDQYEKYKLAVIITDMSSAP